MLGEMAFALNTQRRRGVDAWREAFCRRPRSSGVLAGPALTWSRASSLLVCARPSLLYLDKSSSFLLSRTCWFSGRLAD